MIESMVHPTVLLGALSVPPVFDDHLATEIIETLIEKPVAPRDAREAVQKLLFTGAVTGRGHILEVRRSLREYASDAFQRENPALYRRVARVVSRALMNGSGQMTTAAIGTEGTTITANVLQIAAGGDNASAAFDSLVRQVTSSTHKGRPGDALAVVRQMRRTPSNSERDRQLAFLEGYSMWLSGRRDEALPLLEEVVASGVEDHAFAVAAHLVAASRHDAGLLIDAHTLARDAVRVSQRLNDIAGVALSLGTQGRIERDLALRSERVTMADAIRTLRSAISIGRQAVPSIAGVAALYLSDILEQTKDLDGAVAAAEEGLQLLNPSDPRYFDAVATLGSMYGKRRSPEEAAALLRRGIDAAIAVGRRDAAAVMLNVLAGVMRRQRNYVMAIQYARRSIELGSGNDWHLSQAYHTLALALLDRAGDSASIEEARRAALESLRLLKQFQSYRWIRAVTKTLERIDDVLREA